MTESNHAVLIVDDNRVQLDSLAKRLAERLSDCTICIWRPTDNDYSLAELFSEQLENRTVLVVTDYDLTTAVKGFFGHSIVAWCQSQRIPVGEYSRVNEAALPREPNLFELRVPTEEQEAVNYIVCICKGFLDLREKIEEKWQTLGEGGNLAWMLSRLLGRSSLEGQFAAYMHRLGAANSALLDTSRDAKPDASAKRNLLVYVLGHVIENSILRFPGPILTDKVLCAYLTTGSEELENVRKFFEGARYEGPFSNGRHLYWREDVDRILDGISAEENAEEVESLGDYNRQVVENEMGRELASHDCERCQGKKGGFWCPFTYRATCESEDCSFPASGWIPSGAQLCRIERDFYDEWSPILGL